MEIKIVKCGNIRLGDPWEVYQGSVLVGHVCMGSMSGKMLIQLDNWIKIDTLLDVHKAVSAFIENEV